MTLQSVVDKIETEVKKRFAGEGVNTLRFPCQSQHMADEIARVLCSRGWQTSVVVSYYISDRKDVDRTMPSVNVMRGKSECLKDS